MAEVKVELVAQEALVALAAVVEMPPSLADKSTRHRRCTDLAWAYTLRSFDQCDENSRPTA